MRKENFDFLFVRKIGIIEQGHSQYFLGESIDYVGNFE